MVTSGTGASQGRQSVDCESSESSCTTGVSLDESVNDILLFKYCHRLLPVGMTSQRIKTFDHTYFIINLVLKKNNGISQT